jgi:hypothetical protein
MISQLMSLLAITRVIADNRTQRGPSSAVKQRHCKPSDPGHCACGCLQSGDPVTRARSGEQDHHMNHAVDHRTFAQHPTTALYGLLCDLGYCCSKQLCDEIH